MTFDLININKNSRKSKESNQQPNQNKKPLQENCFENTNKNKLKAFTPNILCKTLSNNISKARGS